MDRYLFLDIDGVINSERTVLAYDKIVHSGLIKERILKSHPINSYFDPIAVALLRQAQAQLHFKIVISSTWRYTLNLPDFHIMFADYGWDTSEIIIGKTGTEDTIRGEQIKMWLDSNTQTEYQYVILDDSSDMREDQRDNFCQTSYYNGLDYDAYVRIFEIFGETYNDAISY